MRRALLLLAIFLAACAGHVCQPGQTRACYDGPPGTKGVGICHPGVQTCGPDGSWTSACPGEQPPEAEACDGLDDDCNGRTDEGVQNVCGGCAEIDGKPGDPCDGCGHLACRGTEGLKCVPPALAPGSSCDENGCAGSYACDLAGEVVCQAPAKNACGVCGGPALDGLGQGCTDADGCQGTVACTADGSATECQGASKNACGVCGGVAVDGVGTACTGANGCAGTLACNATGDGTVCDAPAKNECGQCGGPAVANLGQACGQGDCAGSLACDGAGDAAVCAFPGLGDSCTGPGGCEGTTVCASDGTSTTCDAPTKNACGVCGGPALTGSAGDACSVGACPGTLACNAGGDAFECVPDPTCLPQTDHVVISELAAAGPNGALDEFIELYNPTAAAVSLSGWTLWYHSNNPSGSMLPIVQLDSTASIAAHGFFLVAGATSGATGYSGPTTPDARGTDPGLNMAQSPTGGASVLLTNDNNLTPPAGASDANVVDALGWGACLASLREGSACAPASPAPPGSLERQARPTSTADSMAPGGVDASSGNGEDTNDNGADFVVRAQRDPQGTSSTPEP